MVLKVKQGYREEGLEVETDRDSVIRLVDSLEMAGYEVKSIEVTLKVKDKDDSPFV